MPLEYRIGIDPGHTYIGLSVVAIDDSVATPIYLDVIYLGKGKGHISNLCSRAEKRRARRTRKSAKARIRDIREALQDEGVPEQESRDVIALCRRRGWRADTAAEADAETVDPGEQSIRKPRAEVLSALGELIPQSAPSLSDTGLKKILDILDRKPDASGFNNRRVEHCGVEDCKNNRTLGAYYPIPWIAQHILTHLQPKHRKPVREFFLHNLRKTGRGLNSSSSKFKHKGQTQRALKDYKIMRKLWRAAVKVAPDMIPESVNDNIIRFLNSARNQISDKSQASRLRMCPEHLLKRVRELAGGHTPPQLPARGRTHSITWEAISAKLQSYLSDILSEYLPPEAIIDKIIVERAAFDLLHVKGRKALPHSKINEARWKGPYGQLRDLADDSNGETVSDIDLLSLETGGLCALCGKPLQGEIDRAHLIPKEDVGGYPYIAIVASHSSCNVKLGSNIARIAPEAVEAMQEVRDQIQKKNDYVHAWLDSKKGIMQVLSRDWEEPPPVERYLRQTFTTRQATMQGSDRLGEAVQEAVSQAGRGNPQVIKRSASEVAGARWMVFTSNNGDPWFSKMDDKSDGEAENHAIDAFIAAAIPEARPMGRSNGERLWGVLPEQILERLMVLSTRSTWEKASKGAWPHDKGEPTRVMGLTLRRVWRQAYAKDTKIRENYEKKGRGAYRQIAQSWIETLRQKSRQANASKKMEAHIQNLQFAPLKEIIFEEINSAGPDPKEQYEKVRVAVIKFLKKSTLEGLEGAQPTPTKEHPVREERISKLRDWAEDSETESKVPPWVGITIKEDRLSGGNPNRIEVYQGAQNLESWAMSMWILAVHHDKYSTVFQIEPDGHLSYFHGEECDEIDYGELSETVQVSGVTNLPPGCRDWREKAGQVLAKAGFKKAWVIGQGSQLVTVDGDKISVGLKKKENAKQSLKNNKAKLSKVTDVRRGGLTII